jgi:hypothetical protein
MNSVVTLEYEFSRDDDDFGWLIVHVQTPDFSGRNGMWVQWQDVVDFGVALSRYPIDAAAPVTCEWGFSEDEKYEVITKIVITPGGTTGGLVVDVCLANYYDPQNRCETRFGTDYPCIARFRDEIKRMMRRDAQAAALSGLKANLR